MARSKEPREADPSHAAGRLARMIGRVTTAIGAALLVTAIAPTTASADLPVVDCTRTFEYTGGLQTYTVPVGAALVMVDAYGAEGGHSAGAAPAGLGGYVKAHLPVIPGETLVVSVGQQGVGNYPSGPGTFGGGGGTTGQAGSGGGASDVRQGGSGLNQRVVVAGGGGGVGAGENGAFGGHGGWPMGLKGGDSPDLTGDEGGSGGSQSSGGAAGTAGISNVGTAATSGSFGQGGTGGVGTGNYWYNYGGGGGGGGWYGGGGGKGGSGYESPTSYADGAGGGGGSSYGPNNAEFAVGVRTGHGQVTITALGGNCLGIDEVPPGGASPYPSDDCDAGTDVVSGFIAGIYVKARTAPDPTDPGTTMVCFAIDDRANAHVGGRVDIRVGSLAVLDVDGESGACRGQPGNLNLVAVTVAGQPVRVDITTSPDGNANHLWVCAQLGTDVEARVTFRDAPAVGSGIVFDVTDPHPGYPDPS